MNSLKNPRIYQKNYQTTIFKSNQINKRETQLSRILNKIKDDEKISSKKNYCESNTFNEDLDTNKTKSISSISINERLKESNNNKIKKINLFENEKNTSSKKNVIFNHFNTNRKNNIQSNVIFPIFINQSFKIILKKNQSNKKFNYYQTLNHIRKSFKKTFRIQKNLKNTNKITNISTAKKNYENIFKAKKKSRNTIKYSLSKIKFNKNPLKTEANESKRNVDINVKKSLDYMKSVSIFHRIRKTKSNKNYFSNLDNISISKSRKSLKLFKNTLNKINSKISINSSDNKSYAKEKKEDYNKTYFKNKELMRGILNTTNEKSQPKNKNSRINKIFHFNIKTEINNNTFDSLDKNYEINTNTLNIWKKESFKTINNNKNAKCKRSKIIKKCKYIKIENKTLTNKLTNNINKKKNLIKRKNFGIIKLKTYNTLKEIKSSFFKIQKKISNNNCIKKQNSTLNQENDTFKKNKHQLKNKDMNDERNKIKYINLNEKIQKLITSNKMEMKNELNGLVGCDNFIQIIFSFCENDINLLNKISIISKDIYKKIKPLIYKKISTMINKYNSNNDTKNKIKKYLMKNSSLFKLPSSVLHIRYNDLLFESNKYDNEIKKDLTRTFPDNILFKYGNIYYNKLYHVLTAYSNYNKNIGYVQGINYIAAHILYIFENEIDELIFLDALIGKLNLDKILDNNLNNEFYEKIFSNINSFILKQMPKLDKFLSDMKLNIDFFTTNWILTLFGDSMNTEFLITIWDYMIIFGWKFIKHFILNILLKSENDILNATEENLTYTKKNLLRSEKFKNNFRKILKDTEQMMIDDNNII